MHGREKDCLKAPEHITSLVYLHVILFGIHKTDSGAQKEFDTVLKMKSEHVLTQRLKQSTKWTANF